MSQIDRQFHDSLSVHKGWQGLIAKQQNDKVEIDEVRKNDTGRLHLHDLRNQLYSLTQANQDPLFPVHCAQYVSPLTFGSYTLTLWTAPNLDVALQHAEDFSIVVSSPIRLKYHKDKQGHAELWVLDSEPFNKESHVTYLGVMLFVATTVKIIQSIVEDDELQIKIKLVDNKLSNDIYQQIEQLTHVKISVGEPVRKLCIDKKYLYRSNAHHDHDIYFSALNMLRKDAESLKQGDLILRLYNVLNSLEHLSLANAESVAHSLQLNVRTLNRKLAELNTSYRGVVEKYKLEKALHLLETPNINMTEIAYQLGFADLSTFSRAFKRWTGYSPVSLKGKQDSDSSLSDLNQ